MNEIVEMLEFSKEAIVAFVVATIDMLYRLWTGIPQ